MTSPSQSRACAAGLPETGRCSLATPAQLGSQRGVGCHQRAWMAGRDVARHRAGSHDRDRGYRVPVAPSGRARQGTLRLDARAAHRRRDASRGAGRGLRRGSLISRCAAPASTNGFPVLVSLMPCGGRLAFELTPRPRSAGGQACPASRSRLPPPGTIRRRSGGVHSGTCRKERRSDPAPR